MSDDSAFGDRLDAIGKPVSDQGGLKPGEAKEWLDAHPVETDKDSAFGNRLDAIRHPDRPFMQLEAAKEEEADRYEKRGALEQGAEFLFRRSFPHSSSIFKLQEGGQYQSAIERFKVGAASEDDIKAIARFEHARKHEAEKGIGATALAAAAHLPAIIGEAAMAAPAVKALGLAPSIFRGGAAAGEVAASQMVRSAPAALGLAARSVGGVAAQTAMMPSMYLGQAQERANQNGGEWYDSKNLGPAGAIGVMQVAVLGAIGRVPGALATGAPQTMGLAGRTLLAEGVPGWMARWTAGLGTGMTGQQGIDLVSHALKWSPSWGAAPDLLMGKEGGLKHFVSQVVVFSLFSALHAHHNPRSPGEVAKAKDVMDQVHKAAEEYSQNFKAPEADAAAEHGAKIVSDAMKGTLTPKMVEEMPDGPAKELAKTLAEAKVEKPYAQRQAELADELDRQADEAEKRGEPATAKLHRQDAARIRSEAAKETPQTPPDATSPPKAAESPSAPESPVEAKPAAPESPEGVAKGIEDLFGNLGKGIHDAADAKANEYAQRILKGEKPEAVLEGVKPNGAMWTKVMARVAELSPEPAPKLGARQPVLAIGKGEEAGTDSAGRPLFRHSVTADGKEAGGIVVAPEGDTLHVKIAQGDFGPGGWRGVLRSLAESYPDAKTVEFQRTTGPKAGQVQRVTLPGRAKPSAPEAPSEDPFAALAKHGVLKEAPKAEPPAPESGVPRGTPEPEPAPEAKPVLTEQEFNAKIDEAALTPRERLVVRKLVDGATHRAILDDPAFKALYKMGEKTPDKPGSVQYLEKSALKKMGVDHKTVTDWRAANAEAEGRSIGKAPVFVEPEKMALAPDLRAEIGKEIDDADEAEVIQQRLQKEDRDFNRQYEKKIAKITDPDELSAEEKAAKEELDELYRRYGIEPAPVRSAGEQNLRGETAAVPNPDAAPTTPRTPTEGTAPAAETPAARSGETRGDQLTKGVFDAAFDRLADRYNFVTLKSLREALSQYDRAEVDAFIQQMRANRQYTLKAGQDFDARPEEQAAAIKEDGDTFGHISRLPTWKAEAKPRPGAEVAPPRPEPTDPVMDFAKDLAKEEGGHVVPEAILSRAYSLAEWLRSAIQHARTTWKSLAGNQFPNTAKLNQPSADAMVHYAHAQTAAKFAAPRFIDLILNPKATQAQRRMAGAVETEYRLEYMQEAYLKQEADLLAQAKTKPPGAEYADLVARAAEARKAAAAVVTIIGQPNSPLLTDAQYRSELAKPEHQALQQRWDQHMVPEMEANYKKAAGLDVTDPIDSLTQRPGHPINLKTTQPGETPSDSVVVGGSRGNLRGQRQYKLGFARQAKGTGAYDIDLGAIIENSLAKGIEAATKAEMYRTLVKEGTAEWGEPFKPKEGMKELPDVKPPRGSQEAEKGETSLYIKEEAYPEVRQVLQVDQAPKFPMIAGFNQFLTRVALASSVEAAYHSKNLLTFLFKPGVRVQDVLANTYAVLKNTPEAQTRLMDLAKIGAMKAPGLEAGYVLPAKYRSADPSYYGGRVLDGMQRILRLTAEDAFNRMSGEKPDWWASVVKRVTGEFPFENTEANKRDFINQLGQYNKKSQNPLIVLMRDLGVAPFATAGTNYYVQSMRGLTGYSGAKATTWGGDVATRAETFAKMGAVLGTVAAVNYLAWGRTDGDDKTPLGAIKVGEKGGKTQYFDMTALIGLTRGARQTGLLALAEGERSGKSAVQEEDKAYHDIVTSLIHPFAGPGVQFLHTLATGNNLMGMDIRQPQPARFDGSKWVKPAGLQESDLRRNAAAALWQANPFIKTFRPEVQGVLGTRPAHGDREAEKPTSERAMEVLGPFGLKARAAPKKSTGRQK